MNDTQASRIIVQLERLNDNLGSISRAILILVIIVGLGILI